MEYTNFFTDSQFGFRQNRNTTWAISKLMEQLYRNFDSSLTTQGVFLDFSKAFDTISHDIIINKLKYYGFSIQSCLLLQNYLTNRRQFVKLRTNISSLKYINIGVPQGSVLGPLLFLIYINDLIQCAPKLQYILFADDTNIFTTDHLLLRSEVQNIDVWCLANRLVLNYSKTFQMIFRAPNKNINSKDFVVNIGNKILEVKSDIKFLGITIDSSISFKNHIITLCKKLNLCLLLMRSIRPYLDVKTMVDIYYTFFYPQVIYGIEFWGHGNKTDLKRIITLQKAALRIVLKIKPGEHVTSHFKTLKIMRLPMLFDYRLLVLLLKTFSTEQINNMKPDHHHNTRNKFLRLKKTNNNRGERSLLCTGLALYNRYLMGERLGVSSIPWEGLVDRVWALGG
jgi:hypothetical protein